MHIQAQNAPFILSSTYMLRWSFSIIFFFFQLTGRAFDYPHLGAAGVIADEYLPQAQVEGDTDQYFPQAGIIGITPPLLFNKALGCLSDKYVIITRILYN